MSQKKKGTCDIDMHCALNGSKRCIGKGKLSKRVDNVNKIVAGWQVVYGSGIYRSIGLSECFQEGKKKKGGEIAENVGKKWKNRRFQMAIL